MRRDPSAVRVGRLPGSAASAVQRHDDHTARRRTKRPAIRGAPAANRGAWRGPARIAWVTAFLPARPRSGSPWVSLMTGWDTQNAIVRLLAVLVSLSCALAGCGRGTAGPASLAKLLPEEVGGAELHREAFTGKVWLKRGRSNFLAGGQGQRLEIPGTPSQFPSDLSVAWALLPDGVPEVVAYRARGAFPGRAMAQGKAKPSDPFVLLLKGLYQPVTHGPNLGLSVVDLNDGTYSKTKIYPVSGIPGNTNPNKAVGNFISSSKGICVPTTSPEARLRCALQVAISFLLTTGTVGSSWKEASN